MGKFILEWYKKKKVYKQWPLEHNQEFVVGRNSNHAQIVVDHESISRKHCKIIVTKNGSASLQDLNSANGTIVEDKKINANQLILLREGNQIKFGLNEDILKISCDPNYNVNQNKQKEIQENSRSRSRSKSQKKNKNKDQKPEQKSEFDQKRQLLWKKDQTEVINKIKNDVQKQPWEQLDTNDENKLKFMKLMGVKVTASEKLSDNIQKDISKTKEQVSNIQENLQKQFYQGMDRKDGRRVGLGFNKQ